MTEDERAIRHLVETWFTASRTGDLETVLGLMTDDVVFMVPGAEPFGKQAFAEASKRMQGTRIEGRYEIAELRILGDWAWLRNRIHMSMTPAEGAAPVRRAGYTLTLLARSPDGKWRLARDANLLTQVE